MTLVFGILGTESLLAAAAPAQSSGGGAPCETFLDCQANGDCIAGSCACYPQWTGANCSVLSLLPAPLSNGYNAPGSNTSSWGGGVAFDPVSQQYFMFVSEMNNHCGMQTWPLNSRCVLAVASNPQGPYIRHHVVIESWCHGASVARDPVSGLWLFNHMAHAAPNANCTACESGITPPLAGTAPCEGPPPVAPYSEAALTATSPAGPFSPAPLFPNGGNCETAFAPNGTVYVACPWGGTGPDPVACPNAAFLTVKRADSLAAAVAGNWTQLPLSYSLAGGDNVSSIWCVGPPVDA